MEATPEKKRQQPGNIAKSPPIDVANLDLQHLKPVDKEDFDDLDAVKVLILDSLCNTPAKHHLQKM